MLYRLDWKVSPPQRDLASTDRCPELDIPWTMGYKYPDPLPEPIICPLNPRAGRTMPDIFLTDIPLFSEKLLAAFDEAGVDNIDTYEAEIHSPEGVVHRNYKAANIVGLVSCADLERSEYLPDADPPMMSFTNLVIDEARAADHGLFRLAEDSLVILVSESVQRVLAKAGLVGVGLLPMES